MPQFEIVPWQDKFTPSDFINYQFVDEGGIPTATPGNPCWGHIDEVPEGLDPSHVDIYPRFGAGLSDICNFDFKIKPKSGALPDDFNGADSVDIYFRFTGHQWNDDQFQSALNCAGGTIFGKFQDLPLNLDPNFIYHQRLTQYFPPGTGLNTKANWEDPNLYTEMDIQPDQLPGHPYMRVYAVTYRVKYTSFYPYGTAWWLLGES